MAEDLPPQIVYIRSIFGYVCPVIKWENLGKHTHTFTHPHAKEWI